MAQERVNPEGWLPPWTVREHEERYAFSSQFIPGKTVADCACGNGVGAKVFIQSDPKEYHGFDIDANAIDYASKAYGSQRVTFQTSDCLPIPLPDNAVEVVISLETIEHIDRDREFVKEFRRILQSDGLLILSTPNRTVYNPGTTIKDKPWNPYHVREYTPAELQGLLEEDFVIEQWFGQNHNPGWKVGLMKVVANLIGKRLAVILNQIWKCRWFLFTDLNHHKVSPSSPASFPEYMVVVCRKRH